MSKRNYRRRKSDSGESGEEGTSSDDKTSQTVREILELQKLKKRPPGLSAVELALGKEIPREVQLTTDPFKLKTGGVIDLKTIKKSDLSNADVEEGIKQTFSKESHLRDEDEEMRRYVEEQLAKRKGQGQEETELAAKRPRHLDDVLYELPDRLKRYQSKKTEDMLSNQMLCGIPEVDLGLEAKIKNIEETEAAKLKLLKEAMQKKKNLEETLTARQDLVKDLAKGYVQHNYYKIEEVTRIASEGAKRSGDEAEERIRTEPPVPVVAEDTPRWIQDGKVVQRPDTGATSSKKAVQSNDAKSQSLQPSDKAYFDKFKKKYVSNSRR